MRDPPSQPLCTNCVFKAERLSLIGPPVSIAGPFLSGACKPLTLREQLWLYDSPPASITFS